MTPERWRRIQDLFEEASEQPPELRDRWLAERCGDDAALAQEVREMLDAEAGGVTLVASVGAAASAFIDDRRAAERMDSHAGPYRLLRQLGRGGMGTVFLGERDDGMDQAQVAVKVLHAGLDTGFFLKRFQRERQALGRLQHPNIARILDSGTMSAGQPYIVMELVRGVPITKYCQEHRLSVAEILRVLIDVCRAVEHAHERFVVHRDLKPGNILVEEGGVPKLVDFGICKLIEDRGGAVDTLTGAGLMTPEYASPEQVRGLTITTASDTYALGAVLYELLTGRPPHVLGKVSPASLMMAVCETPVRRPSEVARDRERARQLAGDLDLVLLKALKKDPGQRYARVAEFAEDLRRVLGQEKVAAADAAADAPEPAPVPALRQTVKGRRGVAAAWIGLAALAAGGAFFWWLDQWGRRADPVDRKPVPAFLEAHRLLKIRVPGESQAAVAQRARQAIELFKDAARDYPGSAKIYSGLAEAHLGLADYAGFAAQMKEAAAAARAGLKLDPQSDELHASLGAALLFGAWEPGPALESFTQAVRLNPRNSNAQRLRADVLTMFGRHEAALASLDAVQAALPLNAEIATERASILYRSRRYLDAEQSARQALALELDNDGARFVLGLALEQLGRREEAEVEFRVVARRPTPARNVIGLAHLLVTTGRKAEGLALIAASPRIASVPSAEALIHAGAGDRQNALALIERAWAERDINLLYVPSDPRYDPLRAEPRYLEIFRKVGLPAGTTAAGL